MKTYTQNKLAKLGNAIAISKSETITDRGNCQEMLSHLKRLQRTTNSLEIGVQFEITVTGKAFEMQRLKHWGCFIFILIACQFSLLPMATKWRRSQKKLTLQQNTISCTHYFLKIMLISDFSTSVMWRHLKLLHMWRNFRFLHICHVKLIHM